MLTLRTALLVAMAAGVLIPAGPSGASADGDAVQARDTDLPYMVLPLDAFGDEFSNFRVDLQSGFTPADELGEGQSATYSLAWRKDFPDYFDDPTVTASFGALYEDATSAAAFFDTELQEFIDSGAEHGWTVETFDVGPLGDQTAGLVIDYEGTTLIATEITFRTGPLVGAVITFRYEDVDDKAQMEAAAQALFARMKGVLSGAVTDLPALLPPDLNCDGPVDGIDATLVLQLSAGLLVSTHCDFLADANGDSVVNAVDAALILQFSAGLIDRIA